MVKQTIRALVALYLGLLTTALHACPDGHCERCVFGFCGCVPDLACRVIPQEILPGPTGIPDGILPNQPRLRVTTIEKAVEDITATVIKTFSDAAWNAAKAGSDIGDTVDKAVRDTSEEAKRFGSQVEDAGKAIEVYTRTTLTETIGSFDQAQQRVREGKFVDAIWHASLAPIQVQDKTLSTAALESDYLRTVGQVAASAYGGPAGASAYAAWLAYHQSGGDVTLALRVGILTGASAAAFSAANGIDDIAKKTVVMSAIGGATVAAAGGSQEAIKEAILLAGAMVLIQDGVKKVAHGYELDGKASQGDAYCISPAMNKGCTQLPKDAIQGTDAQGNYIIDMSKVDNTIPAVGLKDNSLLFSEKALQPLSRIPGMQAMAIFHDNWVIDWRMDTLTKVISIGPAISLTYTGLGAPYYELLRETAVEEALRSKEPCCFTAEPRINVRAIIVTDSHTVIDGGQVTDTLLLEQKRDGDRWCSAHGDFLRKSVTPFTAGSQCVHLSKPVGPDGVFRTSTPSTYDNACRVVRRVGTEWKSAFSDLFDNKACTQKYLELAATLPQGEKLYRGQTRDPARQLTISVSPKPL